MYEILDAENLAQETFLSAYRHIRKFDGENLKGWMCTIAANKCRDFLKSPARSTVSLSGEDFEDLEDGRDSPEEVVLERDYCPGSLFSGKDDIHPEAGVH